MGKRSRQLAAPARYSGDDLGEYIVAEIGDCFVLEHSDRNAGRVEPLHLGRDLLIHPVRSEGRRGNDGLQSTICVIRRVIMR